MRKILLALAIVLILSSPAKALDWDTTEKVMFGSYVGLSLLDAYQTSHFPDNVKEGNPMVNGLFGDHPQMWQMLLLKAGIAVPMYFVIDKFLTTHKMRKIGLGIITSLQLGVCISNEVVTGGIAFKF